ncbi:hypothetical protein [Variovorax sp. UC74_104]|uniref:hypothetical protein n=1 Tax=Variovorax sp. UC74_104 TaxID=3374555 RepID=UPI0037584DBE
MREDMDKVIVERPRSGWRVQGDGRKWRNGKEAGSRIGMKRGYKHRKWLNENLAPLKRWLHKQVHRPWDKVYAELCSGIDKRSTVQAHIFEHIEDFVDRGAVMRDGEVLVRASRWGRGDRVPLEEASRVELFVHPVTGILLPNRRVAQARQRERGERNGQHGKNEELSFVEIDELTQWHRVNGDWFEITLATTPPMKAPGVWDKRFDVLRRCFVRTTCAWGRPEFGESSNQVMYGRPDVYAATKRQLSRKEIRARLGEDA